MVPQFDDNLKVGKLAKKNYVTFTEDTVFINKVKPMTLNAIILGTRGKDNLYRLKTNKKHMEKVKSACPVILPFIEDGVTHTVMNHVQPKTIQELKQNILKRQK